LQAFSRAVPPKLPTSAPEENCNVGRSRINHH
jgi:hypothetical protein